MNILYLTNNWQLASTSRILLSWLTLGRAEGHSPLVAVQRTGSLSQWLERHEFGWRLNRMRWPDRRRPLATLADVAPLAWWARRQHVGLIHCNEHDVFPFAVLLRRLLGVPIVCHVRFRVARGFCEWAFGGSRQPDALLWTSRQQMADCADAVAGIVTPERQHFIPLGVDLSTFGSDRAAGRALRARCGIADDEIVIAAASALRPIKRIEDFVRLVASLGERHPKVVGLLAGEGMPGDEEYVANIRRLVEQVGLGRRLQLLGHLEPIEPLHQAADVFVSTSEYETFGNSVCEAMACRVPVAAYTGGSIAEVVGDAGFVVPTGDVDGLRAAVHSLVTDASLRRAYGERARARVADQYNPAVTYQRLSAIYAELTGPLADRRPGLQPRPLADNGRPRT